MTAFWPAEHLLDAANDAIYLLEQDRFIYVNDRFIELFGYDRTEVCSPKFDPWCLVHPDDRAGLESRRRLAPSGAPLPSRYEFRAITRDRRAILLEASITYLFRDDRNAILGVLQEVSARKAYEQQLLRNNHELSVTNVIADAITEVQDLGKILEQVVERLIEVLGVDAAGVSILDDARERFISTYYRGTSETFIRAMRQRDAKSGVLGLAYKTRSIQIIEDIEHDPRLEFGAAAQEGFRSAVAVPLISKAQSSRDAPLSGWSRPAERDPLVARRQCSGVVSVFTRRLRTFTPDDISVFIKVARQIAVAIENARLYRSAAEGMARLQALSEIARAISSTLDVEGVFRIVGDRLQPLIDYTAVDLLVLDDIEAVFRVRRIERPPLGTGPIVRLLESRPTDEDPTLAEALQGQRSIIRAAPAPLGGQQAVVPIIADRLPVGLFLVSAQAPFRTQDRQLLTDLAAHMAISLRNARTFSALERAYRELKDANELLVRAERLQALGEMAAGVAHDFNNVLSAILGRAQMLEVMLKDENHLRSVRVISKAALDGADTVRRIQAFAKEKPETPLKIVTLNPVVREAVDRAAPLVGAPERAVEMLVDLQDVPQVLGDAVELREAMANLINNALDAMPHGGRLTVRTGTADSAPWFEVIDTGIGMDRETANKIFDPFFSTKGDQGSGLGLSVTYAIVQRHGGRFEVDSARNQGTRIRVYLEPAMVSGDWPSVADPATKAHDAPDVPRQGARLLLIEDDVAVREVLADILRTGEHLVIAAANGSEGLRQFAENEFDMVLTDLGMPDMDGWAVAQAVKASRPHVPVGLITGWGSDLEDIDLAARGVDILVAKPVRFNDVLEAVDTALGQKR